jgi:hypothetical protein
LKNIYLKKEKRKKKKIQPFGGGRNHPQTTIGAKGIVGKGSARRFVNGNPIKAARQIIDLLQMRKQILVCCCHLP